MNFSNAKGLIIGSLTITKDVLALEYSHSQNAYHVCPFVQSLQNNIMAFATGRPNDYVLIGIFPNEDELEKFQKYWIPRIDRMKDRSHLDISNKTFDDLFDDDES